MRHEPFEQLPLIEKLMKRKEDLEQARKRSPARQTQQSAANATQQKDSATASRAAMSV